jgi:hypothetical protein
MNFDLREPEADEMKTGPGVKITEELEPVIKRT